MLRITIRKFHTYVRLSLNKVTILSPPNTNRFFSYIFTSLIFIELTPLFVVVKWRNKARKSFISSQS